MLACFHGIAFACQLPKIEHDHQVELYFRPNPIIEYSLRNKSMNIWFDTYFNA